MDNSQINPTQYNPTSNQNLVYLQPVKRKTSIWKYLLGCGFVTIFAIASCIIPSIALSVFSNYVGSGNNSKIKEEVLYTTGDTNSSNKAKIAIVNISGAITYSVPGENITPNSSSSKNIIDQLNKAKNDNSIDAVVIRLNTPGGEVPAAEPICRAIKDVNTKKPVYSFIDSMGASLGYLIPNCSKYIYARPSSITGSIGVILQAIDFYGVLEKAGGKVKFVTNSEGTMKSGQDIFDEKSETYKIYQKNLDEVYEHFLQTVYNGRKANHPTITLEDIKKYADGRILSGNQAKELKFIDELGEFEDMIASVLTRENLMNKKVSIVQYSLPSSPLSQLFGGINSALQSADIKNQLQRDGKIRFMMQADLLSTTIINK